MLRVSYKLKVEVHFSGRKTLQIKKNDPLKKDELKRWTKSRRSFYFLRFNWTPRGFRLPHFRKPRPNELDGHGPPSNLG